MRFSLLLFLVLTFVTRAAFGQQSVTGKIDQYVLTKLENTRIPGVAIAVVNRDSVILSKGYGINSKGEKITGDSPFAIASLSKAFAATAVMQLVEKELIDLDEPVSKYVPEFQLADSRGSKITARNLLNQLSGLEDKVFPEMSFYQEPGNLQESIARMKSVNLNDGPGERFHYHNPNFQLVALLVEKVSGESFDDYLNNHLFQPLQMNHTLDVPSTASLQEVEGFSNGHIFVLGKAFAHTEPGWFVEGGAGVVSTSNDMAKWLMLNIYQGTKNGVTLLDSASIKTMRNPPPSFRYGMGWFVRDNGDITHSGVLWTYSAQQIITADGYGITILSNGGLTPFNDYDSFIEGINDILHNKQPDASDSSLYYITAFVVLLTIAIGLAVRRLLRTKVWVATYHKRSHWKSYLFLSFRLIPLIFLILFPSIVTSTTDRVLNWPRTFLMMPDIITMLVILAGIHLAIIIVRLVSLKRYNVIG